nr:ABC transporter ATP-binding protein [uncultured Campylobacter sp.]
MLIGGKSVRDYGKRELASLVAYVPQTHAPSYDYSVFDVPLVGALCRTPLFSGFSAADKKLAEQTLEKMGIAHLKNAPYTRVSGGERAYTRELLSIAASSSQRRYTQATRRFW